MSADQRTSPAPTTTRRRAVDTFKLLTAVAVVTFLATACGGSSEAGRPPDSGSSEPARVLAPRSFHKYLADNPDIALVNVHIPYEGHIDGTDAFVPFEEIAQWDGLPDDRSTPLALYCRSGRMSAIAAEALAEEGYTNLVDLDGGMGAWTAAGYELIDDVRASEPG